MITTQPLLVNPDTYLFVMAAVTFAAHTVFSVVGRFITPSRAQALRPNLDHLWQLTIVLLLAAIYLEIST